MSQYLKHLACLIAATLFLATNFTGCGNSESADDDSAEITSADLPETKTSTVTAAKSTNLVSPAASESELPAPDSSPQEVCQRFLKLLQSGNRIGAENLFTRTALTTTTRAGLKLEPMGGPSSTFRVGEVRYATNRQKLAHVDCYIIDKGDDGETYEMEVTWQLNKLGQGWRISGVMLQLEEGKTKDLLSLENQYDVAKLQSLAGAEVLDETESRQANAGSDTTIN